MQKWEYKIEEIRDIPGYYEGNKYGNSKRMTKFYGIKGWELVSVNDGIAYFKRPIENEEVQVKNVLQYVERINESS